ncbi:MAG: type VI secretion system contractile sheath small subunit [Candidatus Cloacimonetes bacterium]|nr:type VI secretion system contractile sheath small subunit [Candidatus Cloacimonadota bacterium]
MSETIAPRTKVNIKYGQDSKGKGGTELPENILVLGNFSGRESDEELSEMEAFEINKKEDLNKVLGKLQVEIKTTVKDRLRNDGESEIPISIKVSKMSDFEPDHIVEEVPELKKLMELRQALKDFKSNLNSREFKNRIQGLVNNPDEMKSILDSLIEASEER